MTATVTAEAPGSCALPNTWAQSRPAIAKDVFQNQPCPSWYLLVREALRAQCQDLFGVLKVHVLYKEPDVVITTEGSQYLHREQVFRRCRRNA
jgi:hypothetical protein